MYRNTNVCNWDLHAVASCQVSVQEVATAEILHTQSNVNHELQERLSGQKLKNTRMHNCKTVGSLNLVSNQT